MYWLRISRPISPTAFSRSVCVTKPYSRPPVSLVKTRAGFVLGALWNGKDAPMGDAYTDENTSRMIQTKSGHQILLSDKDGEEKITISDYGLTLIADAAEGSMRDAQSLLDQAVAFSGQDIRDEDLKEILGAIGRDLLFGCSSLVFGQDPAANASRLDRVASCRISSTERIETGSAAPVARNTAANPTNRNTLRCMIGSPIF